MLIATSPIMGMTNEGQVCFLINMNPSFRLIRTISNRSLGQCRIADRRNRNRFDIKPSLSNGFPGVIRMRSSSSEYKLLPQNGLSEKPSTINCPNCSTAIDVQQILVRQLQMELEQKQEEEAKEMQKFYEYKLKELKESKKMEEERLRNEFETVLHEERQKIVKNLKVKLEKEQADQIEMLTAELNEKSAKLKDLNRSKSEIEKLRREKAELEEEAEAMAQKRINDSLEKERRNFHSQLEDLKGSYSQEISKLNKEKENFKLEQEKQIMQHKIELEKNIRRKIEQDQEQNIKTIKQELEEKSAKLRELNAAIAENERLKRQNADIKSALEAEAEKKISMMIEEAREKIKKEEEERHELRYQELRKQLDDQRRLTNEMKRKQETTSSQLSGEVQELVIESWLRNRFPLDEIKEVKKGVKGADCVQVINAPPRMNCGTILYESKRAKDFSKSWIEKFKNDIREKEASVGVLVVEKLPNHLDRMECVEGIWICDFEDFKALSSVLRESVINISFVTQAQENKSQKMSVLYEYLTSSAFRMQVEAIVEGFSMLKSDLEKEKRAMQRIWKTREKQIEKVLDNTIGMYGAIKGIAGNAIQPVYGLELPEAEDSENDSSDTYHL